MGRQAIINGFMAGELSPLMSMRSDLKGMKYGVRQAINWALREQGPASTRVGTAINNTHDIIEVGSFFDETTRFGQMVHMYDMEHDLRDYYVWCRNTIEPTYPGIIMFYGTSGAYYEVALATADPFFNTAGKSQLYLITIIQPPGLAELWFFHPYYPARRLYHNGTAWVMVALSFTAAPSEWAALHFNNGACFFQNRLYVAGSGRYGHIFWASKVGDFLNFTIGSNPADAMQYDLEDFGEIRWMMGSEKLVIGTENFEYVVNAQDDVVMPGDIQVRKQSSYGSSINSAISIGSGVLYRSKDNKQIRQMEYRWKEDRWISMDLLFTAEHLVKDAAIVHMAYDSSKRLLYCVLEDNTVIQGAFTSDMQTVGWTPWIIEHKVNALNVISHDTKEVTLFIVLYDTANNMYLLTQDPSNYSLDRYEVLNNNYAPYSQNYQELKLLEGDDYSVQGTKFVEEIGAEFWDSDAAAFVGGLAYSWTGTDVVPVANNWIQAKNYEFKNGPLSSAGDLIDDLIPGQIYILSFDYYYYYYLAESLRVQLRNYSDATTYDTIYYQYHFGIEQVQENWRVHVVFTMPTPNALGLFLMLGVENPAAGTVQISTPSLHIAQISEEDFLEEDVSVDSSGYFKTTHITGGGAIGIPYTCTLETLPLNRELPEPTHGKKKRWSKAYIRVIDSYPVSIEGRSPANYTKATQDQQVSLQGWDREATITIVQDKPYKSVIAGVYGELAEYVL